MLSVIIKSEPMNVFVKMAMKEMDFNVVCVTIFIFTWLAAVLYSFRITPDKLFWKFNHPTGRLLTGITRITKSKLWDGVEISKEKISTLTLGSTKWKAIGLDKQEVIDPNWYIWYNHGHRSSQS